MTERAEEATGRWDSEGEPDGILLRDKPFGLGEVSRELPEVGLLAGRVALGLALGGDLETDDYTHDDDDDLQHDGEPVLLSDRAA